MPLNPEKAGFDYELFLNYRRRNYREFRRERDNWRMYDATDFGQWNQKAVDIAVQEGRPLSTYNFIKKVVNTTTGSIIADPFETKFDTELGDPLIWAIVANILFLEDKDLSNIAEHYWEVVRAGHIYRGVWQMYVDRSKDVRGRVGMRYLSPDRVTFSANWRTSDVNDNDNIYLHTWMTPQQIQDKFDIHSDEIEQAIKNFRETQDSGIERTEVDDGNRVFDNSPEFYNQTDGTFLVLERHWLEQKKMFQIFDADQGVPIATVEKESAQKLRKIYEARGINTMILPTTRKKEKVRTTIPGLSLKLIVDEGYPKLQIGRFPFFSFSSDMINGRPNTDVDTLKDPQVDFNKRNATATHILMTQSNNALFIESDAVEDESEIDTIGKGKGRPGAYFKVSPGTNNQNKIKYLDRGTPPNDFLNAGNNIREMIRNDLTPAVPAIQALTSGEESGILFQSRVAQAQVAMQRTNKLLGAMWHQIGDAYLQAMKVVYTYPMLVKDGKTGQMYWLNVPGGIDVTAMPRLKVTVSQAPTSETHRRRLLQSYLAISQYLHDPFTRSELTRIVIKSLPDIPEEELALLSESAKLSSEAQRLALETQIAQMKQQAQAGQTTGAPQQLGSAAQGQNPEQLLATIQQQAQNEALTKP